MADRGAVNRDGFILDWVREGEGVPMLVLGAHRYYERVFPDAMRSDFEMVFCATRQWVVTPSGFDIATITRDTFSEDVDAIRRATELERPIVVGHSQHGLIALEYARRHPDQVRGVVAIAVPVSSEGLEPPHLFAKRDSQHDRLAAHE